MELITAKQMLEISINNADYNLREILEKIESVANTGLRQVYFCEMMINPVKEKLIELGYTINPLQKEMEDNGIYYSIEW